MIELVIGAIVVFVLLVMAIGISEARRAPARRLVAAQRRRDWEQRYLERHDGVEPAGQDDWDDD